MFSFTLFKIVGPDPLLHHMLYVYLYIYLAVYCICVQIGLCVQWLWRYIFWDVRNMCLDVSSWEVFSLSPSADYTEYLICFSNQHAWGFGNSVKKDVRRSWEERWSEIAGERRPLINRRSGQLFGSHSSLSWNTSLSPSLSVSSCCSHSPWICPLFSNSSIHSDLQNIESAFVLCLSELLTVSDGALNGPKFSHFKENSCCYSAKKTPLNLETSPSFGFSKWHHVLWVWL